MRADKFDYMTMTRVQLTEAKDTSTGNQNGKEGCVLTC